MAPAEDTGEPFPFAVGKTGNISSFWWSFGEMFGHFGIVKWAWDCMCYSMPFLKQPKHVQETLSQRFIDQSRQRNDIIMGSESVNWSCIQHSLRIFVPASDLVLSIAALAPRIQIWDWSKCFGICGKMAGPMKLKKRSSNERGDFVGQTHHTSEPNRQAVQYRWCRHTSHQLLQQTCDFLERCSNQQQPAQLKHHRKLFESFYRLEAICSPPKNICKKESDVWWISDIKSRIGFLISRRFRKHLLLHLPRHCQ